MIRMIPSTSASHAKAYFSDALLKSDYYLNDQELQGQYHGKLAERIGLQGGASKETFFALCENINPVTGKPMTPRKRDDRTTGYDINFHCPKSVSVVNALSNDSHILEAFQKSVLETMKDIEADSQARVRKGGKSFDRQTGELLWAEFTHQTARPVDGSAPDPHLHSHCFVFNATWDAQEKMIKAGQFKDINRDMPYYQAMFHKRLADNLEDLGYQIRRTEKSFEIEGVPQNVINLFSKRTNEIGEFAKEKGITDAHELSNLGARTRAKKQKGLSMIDLKAEWRQQIKAYSEVDAAEAERPVRYAKRPTPRIIADDCVEYALKHCYERASVMPERRLLENVYRHSVGHRNVSLPAMTDKFNSDGRIIRVKEKGRTFCTTKEVLKEEQRMVMLARKGQGRFQPLFLETPALKAKGQAATAIEHVLTTKHQVSIIRGAAGAGKTTLLKEAVQHIKNSGKKVTLVAPTAQASRGVLAQEGFANAETVAKLLVDKEMQESLYGQVLIVDEAGMLGTRDMSSLLSLADKQNARLILVGDTRQHASVVRGDALRILNTVGGIKTAQLSIVQRQKNEAYRSAVQDLSEGNIEKAFNKLDDIGAIEEIDPSKPNEKLVNDYVATIKRGKSALIVSPTHKQGDSVTDDVRERLKATGLLGKKEVQATKLSNLNLTEAEKSDWRKFEKGQIIQFNQNVPKIKRGSSWVVQDVDEQKVVLQNTENEQRTLPRDKPTAYDVFKAKEIGLAKGDNVKITKNSFDKQDKRLNNGTSLEVASVSKKGDIILRNKASKATFHLSKDFGHLSHDYCTTSHSAQGKTVDEVFISQPAGTFGATNAKQFYVSVSRGQHAVTIYTDDKAALLQHASEIGDRQSALELVQKQPSHDEYVQKLERGKYMVTPSQNKSIESIQRNQERDYEPGF
ncbi:MobF family relaxase [Mucilaginibacter polytrichastri]|nr:MobF family relaxase [Mucilaginibacter polytrichastri]